MQQHPGASLRFHFVTDRITTCRYKILRPVSHPPNVHSFVGTARTNGAVPPALFKKGGEGRKKKEVLHLSRCYTHTHMAEPGKPWKARGRKKRTHDGPTAKNSAGGEGNRRTSGTNLHGETDLTKPEHTPEPNDTLRRNQQEGDWGPMGTSWWKKETTKLIGTQVPKQDSVPKYLGFVRCSLSGTVVKSCPNWHKRLSSSIELGAQHVSPHQKPKWPHLQEEDVPVAFCRTCHVELQKLKLQW